MHYKIFGILDTKTGELSGTLLTLRHEIEAVRIFGQLAGNKNTSVGNYPQDHQLVMLGTVDAEPTENKNNLTNQYEVIMTGETFLATQETNA